MRFNHYLNEDQMEYSQYVAFLDNILNESISSVIPSFLREIKQVILEIAKDTKEDISSFMELLKDRNVFTFLHKIGLTLGLRLIKSFSILISKPLEVVFKELHSTALFNKIVENKGTMNDFLEKNPVLKTMSKYALAGMLIFIWLNVSFTGSIDFDMDLSIINDAISGKYTIVDFLTSKDLVKSMVLVFTGAVMSISFIWMGSSVYNVLLALLYTVAKKKKHRILPKLKVQMA